MEFLKIPLPFLFERIGIRQRKTLVFVFQFNTQELQWKQREFKQRAQKNS